MIEPELTWPMATLLAGVRLAGHLPLRVLHIAGSLFGGVLWLLNGRARKVTQRNLELVLPHEDLATRSRLARAALAETGKSMTEIARIWSGNPQRALALVRDVRGGELLDAALASERGVVICAPHLGCWELLNYWLAARMPLAIVYRPPKLASLEALLLKARGALEVEQVRAEGAGVRALYRRLASGGAVGILPDQQPKQGEGQFAPFFGIEALTMVLVSRLAHRTGAQVLFAFTERLPRGAGFRIHLNSAPDGVVDSELRVACSALNAGVERCVREAFVQYQWHYKRYSRRPQLGDPELYPDMR
ncbi:MAG: lipid A biosynthesis acyltransferase [Dokdonella sp.]